MKKRLQLALAGFFLFVFSSIQANPDTIFLHTQTDVDNFQATYAETVNLPGGVIIRTSGSPAITNLNGLSSIETIGTFLHIENNSSLTNISGLSSLTEIAGELKMLFNNNLTNLNGFSSLTEVGGRLFLGQNNNITNINGLSSLHFAGSIRLVTNNNLDNLNGLSSLTEVGGDFVILSTGLTSLDGLSSLTEVGGDFALVFNSNISNINALSNLTSISGGLFLNDNPMLADCRGITQLVDAVDDGLPGPSFDSTPDVGGVIGLSGNIASCSSIGEILLGYRVLTTQQEVNDLELGADNTLDGNLIIGPSANITNLTNLQALRKVAGNLIIIDNDELESFGGGLVNLDSVGCNFQICGNEELCNLEELAAGTLVYVSQDLIVTNNPMLSDCCGLIPLFTTGTVVGTVTMNNNSEPGNCNNDGADVTEANCLVPIPTLSQWGLFLFACIVLTLGMVFLYNTTKLKESF
jgi:hypothetical protein